MGSTHTRKKVRGMPQARPAQETRSLNRSHQEEPFTLRGSLELCCSPEELEEELTSIRSRWTASVRRLIEEDIESEP